MNSEETQSKMFSQDYRMLELNELANWQTARASYRRLVHQWHPDRYTHRPREKAHAQQQFIVLTKSYDSLRSFYRIHQRLPFEAIRTSTPAQKDSTKPDNRKSAQAQDEFTGIDRGLLKREASHTANRLIPVMNSKLIWIFAAFAMMLVTVAVSMMLDLNANRANMEKGREVLRQAPASDFMPTQAEIRKSNARGAFVQPTK